MDWHRRQHEESPCCPGPFSTLSFLVDAKWRVGTDSRVAELGENVFQICDLNGCDQLLICVAHAQDHSRAYVDQKQHRRIGLGDRVAGHCVTANRCCMDIRSIAKMVHIAGDQDDHTDGKQCHERGHSPEGPVNQQLIFPHTFADTDWFDLCSGVRLYGFSQVSRQWFPPNAVAQFLELFEAVSQGGRRSECIESVDTNETSLFVQIVLWQ